MCGILGSINAFFDEEILNQLSHRGPDDFGIIVQSIGANKIMLGHRRLSIVDLSSAGHQPMVSPCNRFCLLFNGEIYNHKELRSRLPSSIQFKGHCDSETVLHYLIHFGLKGLADLNGIFSIAFLDLDKGQLTLARDPFGVKPLYYSNYENKLGFCSEIRPLLSLFNDFVLNDDSLATLLRLRFIPSPLTLYNGIKKVRPGYYVLIDLKSPHIHIEEVSFIRPIPRKKKIRMTAAADEYGRKLEEAVNRQMMSDVEVGLFLSGGVDSALISALATKSIGKGLKAYTVGFENNTSENEIEEAAITAKYLGLDHYTRHIDFYDFINKIKECTSIVEEPLATTSIIPMYYLADLASKDVKVVLTGQGADEPLGGYKKYKLELFNNLFRSNISRKLVKSFNIERIKNESLRRGLKSFSIKDDIKRFLSIYELFTEFEINNLINVKENSSMDLITNYFNVLKCQSISNTSEQMMALDSRLNLADDLLNYTDKISMRFSIECRVPMLDIELVEYIESLPRSLKVNFFNGKIVHKKFAESLLPEYIVNRKKKGFLSPTKEWFKEEVKLIKDLILAPSSEFSRIFQLDEVNKILNQHASGYNREKQIFLLISIYFWLEEMSFIKTGSNRNTGQPMTSFSL